MISYYHIVTKSQTPNGWSHFSCQVNVFDTYWVVYPSSKEVSPKVRALRAITFYDASVNADQKILAPPKPHFFEKKIGPENFCNKKNPHGWSHFWCQVNVFDTYWVIYPFSKEVSPKIRPVEAITFYDAAAIAGQKILAPPKLQFYKNITNFFFSESKNENLQIVWNTFCQSFAPIRALFGT